MQYPTEVPGVSIEELVGEALVAAGRPVPDLRDRLEAEAARIEFDTRFLDRSLNVDFSGGEKKRNETLQLAVLRPKIAILDELDSGLDVDALRLCSQRVEAATQEDGLGVIAITHYKRLLDELRPDFVHVLAKGTIQLTGGAELAEELERTGYAQWIEKDTTDTAVHIAGFGDDPFDGIFG
jgi:Fe-S cluster assembly ATP-binding protein